MAKSRYPTTQAIRFLKSEQVDFKPYSYTYVEHGGAGHAAEQLCISPHRVVKTLVMETDKQAPLLTLMHGDQTVSTGRLARAIGVKRVLPIHPDKVLRGTGYPVGGISPFGIRKAMPVFVQRTILALTTIFINGGKRGFLVEIEPGVLLKTLHALPVDVAAIDP